MTSSGDRGLESRLADALGSAYTIEGEIGRGGMGVVYRAKDERLKRSVAVKVLPPELAYRGDIRARFMREAETSARLSHPNIVPIHAVGDANDLVYFIMGFVDGESLGLRLKRRGRLSVDEARRIMREAADALAAAHQQGVIHRDVKPDNILLEGTRGRVMVTDFGIAKALSSESGGTLTEAGVAIGTPAFMSPEQAAGEREIDGRSDLYSLGVVTYQMLTGELPFQAPTVPGLLMKQIMELPAPVERKRPETPKELSQTVMRCLEKDPEDRWPTADALRRALETNTYTAPPPRAGARRRPGADRAALDSLGGALDRGRRAIERAEERAGQALQRGDQPGRRVSRRAEREERRRSEKEREEEELKRIAKSTGEPLVVTRFRSKAATFAAVNGMLVLLNIATTQLDPPWALFPIVFWGFGLAKDYAKLWTTGYSWRDVIHRPPAPDAVEAKTTRAGMLAPLTADEFGAHTEGIEQARSDRAAVLAMLERMPKSERKLLPEIAPTVDQLLERATDLARTLNALERDIDMGSVEKLEARIAAMEQEPPSAERERRMTLLQQQRQKVAHLMTRRAALSSQLESCLLAMQNVRFDLLRLRSSGVAEALGDLTAATQQARALSRDVDAAIMAAGEVRKLTNNDANLTRD
ncbi:MAG: protein kinase [Gemmatimonadales bacterium]|nr:protein kinase [Gemmatimonadales bacterium]